MDQSRFSQRVTHFVDLHHQQQQASFDQQQQQQQFGNTTAQNKLFIRPMSPVTVDQQHQESYQQRQASIGDRSNASSPPLSHQSSYPHYQQQSSSSTATLNAREIAIRDPYSSHPVTFSVIDPQLGPNSNHTMTDGSLPGGEHTHQIHQYQTDDGHSDYSMNVDTRYIDDIQQPHLH